MHSWTDAISMTRRLTTNVSNMTKRSSLPRAAKLRAIARIKVHCPPCSNSLWERLPNDLQDDIKEIATKAWARETMRHVHVELLQRAYDRKAVAAAAAAAAR